MAKNKSTKKQKTTSQKKTTPQKATTSAASVDRVKQHREEKKRQKRRQQLTTYAIIGIVVVVVGIFAFVLVNAPAEAPIPDGTLERYDGLEQTQNADGFFVLGDPGAPVSIVEYSSFSCPACKAFYDSAMDEVVDFVRDGDVSYTFVPRFVGEYRNAEGAAKGAFCAGEQGMFFEMHDMLFSWQSTYGNNAFSQNRLVSGAGTLGLDEGDFRGCLGSGRADSYINTANDEAESRGYSGAPITTVQGVPIESTSGSLINQVNSALSRVAPGQSSNTDDTDVVTPESTPEAEATETIAAPITLGLQDEYADVEESVTDDGFYRMGSADAPIVVEEFASYSCPGCFAWHDLSQDTLVEAAEAGDIQVIYYPHFTGSVDADNLEDATKAAFCAGEQSAFFAYSAVLYSWHGQFGDDAFEPARLVAGAGNLGLDADAFADCVASDAATEFVDAARENVDARDVSSTPTVIIDGEELEDLSVDALAAAIAPAEAEASEDEE